MMRWIVAVVMSAAGICSIAVAQEDRNFEAEIQAAVREQAERQLAEDLVEQAGFNRASQDSFGDGGQRLIDAMTGLVARQRRLGLAQHTR